MLPSPVPADPGWDEDLTWLDRDPMTAEEFEASLDRLCELDEGPGEDEDENYLAPLTAEELAEIREDAGAARHLHRTDLPSAFHSGGLRAQHSV